MAKNKEKLSPQLILGTLIFIRERLQSGDSSIINHFNGISEKLVLGIDPHDAQMKEHWDAIEDSMNDIIKLYNGIKP